MYKIKNKIVFENQKEIAKQIGIAEETLCRILSGKQLTSKTTAYCIVKTYDINSEIEDFFEMEGK